MKQILIISGKGGTGKTVLAASMAALAENKVMVDCDVDAADLYLLLHPEVRRREEFRSGKTLTVLSEFCEQCGRCVEVCRFNAIGSDFRVDPISCEGCGLCSRVCPNSAIKMEESLSGEWFVSETKYGPLVHAKLGIAKENSGKLVSTVRKEAEKIAQRNSLDYVIIDGPPGIGCPVIASLGGVDLALIIVEPTLSGIHDMERVIELVKHFQVESAVAINKYDLNVENTERIKGFCKDENIKVLAQLPFTEEVVQALVRREPVVRFCEGEITEEIVKLWEKLK